MKVVGRALGRRGGTLVALACLAVAMPLLLAGPAQARSEANLSLDVTFNANGSIAVTLPDGTPVGSVSGTPTVIPAGFYSVLLSGPGGCTNLPYFSLQGPGVNILDNMDEGEMASSTDGATFAPNSTYTWSDAATPSVVYTFTTSAQVEGTPPPAYSSGSTELTSSSHSTASSQDLVGSNASKGASSGAAVTATTLAGTLTGMLEGGRPSLLLDGRALGRLAPGRYRLTVSAPKRKTGFELEKVGQTAARVSAAPFLGTRSVTVVLTAGTWYLAARPSGARSPAISVG